MPWSGNTGDLIRAIKEVDDAAARGGTMGKDTIAAIFDAMCICGELSGSEQATAQELCWVEAVRKMLGDIAFKSTRPPFKWPQLSDPPARPIAPLSWRERGIIAGTKWSIYHEQAADAADRAYPDKGDAIRDEIDAMFHDTLHGALRHFLMFTPHDARQELDARQAFVDGFIQGFYAENEIHHGD
jgi:hypothetical protein